MYHAMCNFLQIWVLVSQYFPVFVFCLEFLEPLSNDGICPLFTGLGEKERILSDPIYAVQMHRGAVPHRLSLPSKL